MRDKLGVLQKIDQRHRYWCWRERLSKVLPLGIAAVVILGLCVGLVWMRFSASGVASVAQDAEPNSPEAEDARPEVDSGQSGWPDLLGLREKVLPSLVTIQRDYGRGTGFIIEKGLVVTAYHVAPNGHEAVVVFQDGERAKVVEHVACDSARDVAVLRIDTKRKLQPLGLAPALPTAGEPVASFRTDGGELRGKVIAGSRGEVVRRVGGCEILQTTLNAVPGWSGSPVVNMEGRVVGIVSVLDGGLFRAGGITIGTGSGAVPVTVLQELLAVLDLDKAIRLAPEDAARYHKRGRFYHSKGNYDKAIPDYDEAIRLKPAYAEAHCSRGRAYAAMGNLEAALADFTYVIRLEPKLTQTYYDRGKLYAAQGRHAQAISDFTKAIRLDPANYWAYTARGAAYAACGGKDKAIADYGEAVLLKPVQAVVYRLRGVVCATKGEHEQAVLYFTEALRLEPKDAEAYCARGAVHGARREFHKAVADFTEAIRLDSGFADAYRNRAVAYQEMGYENEARADFARARELQSRLRLEDLEMRTSPY